MNSMVELFYNALMSKSYVSLKNILFTKCVAQLVERIKQLYVLPKLVECYSATRLLFVDVKREHMTFCFDDKFLRG